MPVFYQNEPHPETDGASPARSRRADIHAQITELEMMTTADLRTEWQRHYRTIPPIRTSRDLLLRGIAYKIQEQAHGGLGLRTYRRLRALADAGQQSSSAAPPATALRPGTKLVREWRGRIHTVNVMEIGFEYQDERYRSLSRIAQQITGVHRSGPLFFGVGNKPSRREPGGE